MEMSDWFIKTSSDGGRRPQHRSVVGNFLTEVRMNQEDGSVLGVQIEGVKKDDGTLELTIISGDTRRLVRTTVSGNKTTKEEVVV